MSSESGPRAILVRCLALGYPSVLAPLTQATERAIRYGGVPFEVIAGTPRARYGARLTFRPRGDRAALAAAFDLGGHPWGPPAWLGVRVRPDGALAVKPYHELPRPDLPFALPAGLPAGLHPVMASLHGGATELYLRLRPPLPWAEFVAAVLGALEVGAVEAGPLPEFAPYPHPAAEGYCLSLRWEGAEVTAVSLFADARALPGDDEVRRLWPQGMDEAERNAYEAALAGVRQLGRPGPRGAAARHALLGWTWERGGGWHRAASLRLPSTSSPAAPSSL